jgi:hypothetical protein
MDDFILSNLHEARNEWSARLVGILTPLVIEGIRSIFNESWKLSVENKEVDKYLMTFQNLLCRVPKWNAIIIEDERKRIIERSGCNYLEDLITCVHIIQLKVLTSIRVGQRQKKLDIATPKLDNFIHKVYIHVARKVYMNVYLFEKNISPLLVQKHNRELEIIVQECILATVRDSIPTESIIRAYLDESVEQEEEVIIENIENPVLENSEGGGEGSADSMAGGPSSSSEHEIEKKVDMEESIPPNKEEDVPEVVPSIQNIDNEPIVSRLTFNEVDSIINEKGEEEKKSAPKSIEHLEKISMERKISSDNFGDSDDESDDDTGTIQIHTDDVDLSGFNIINMDDNADVPILDFEEIK